MKILETEFVENANCRGNNKFVQIKRNEYAAIYRRFTMDGNPREFEVFQIKIAGGTEVFGRFYDKYEQYPGASAFGKSAWSTPSEDRANQIFDEITNGQGLRNDGLVEVVKIVKAKSGKRGRKAAIRPAVMLPKKQFSMKDLASANVKGWTKPMLYIELQRMIKAGKARVAGKRTNSAGRGKPLVIYMAS